MKIIVAPDSFKGSLTAAEVAEAVSAALAQAMPGCEVHCLPVSDGGEGLVQALAPALGAAFVRAQVHGPLGRMTSAVYAVKGELAIIEMAAASGLELLKPDELDVMNADSRGLGELILDALDRGCRDFLIGIGGSATNDAGMGMLHALGWRFSDAAGEELSPKGASLESVASI
ncbi:MAG: glycerate kinase, partial [Bacteroidales bacterium]|nr:glycerate kinase [Bacteroidales bacterium]